MLFLLLVFILSSFISAVELPMGMDLYLLIGQSNMAGRGVIEPQDQEINPQVFTLDQANQWVPATDPLHFDKSQAGVGPGRSFGLAMARHDAQAKIGLIPCAVGGTSIRNWRLGGADSATGTHPWDDMLVRARIALKSGTLKGILWHQGEADGAMGLDGSYYTALDDLIWRVRGEFNVPDAPFVIGQLGQFPSRPWSTGRQAVDACQQALARNIPRVGFASSAGLTDKGDSLHFSAAGARTLGERFAAVMIQLQNAPYPYRFPPFDKLQPNPELPPLLTMLDGRPVTTAKLWLDERRSELEQMVLHYEYGYVPPAPGNLKSEVEFQDEHFLEGKATLKQIKLTFGPKTAAPMHLLMAIPNGAKGCPVFLGLNFTGNHTVTDHPGIPLATTWVSERQPGVVNNQATEQTRGAAKSRWPLELMIARGYGVATFYQGDIDPDNPDLSNGIQACYYRPGQTEPEPHEWGAIAAWAWGLSRAADYLVTDPAVDAERLFVMGHSRNGKAGLLAGALDTRFALVVSNESGCSGAALSRRRMGETVERINTSFPHWFDGAFKEFNGKEDYLPIDQHMVIALVAPRPILVCSAQDDLWSDPEGEFLSLKAASPVYALLTGSPIPDDPMPPVNTLTSGRAAYHIRPGKHDIGAADWTVFMDFADRCFSSLH